MRILAWYWAGVDPKKDRIGDSALRKMAVVPKVVGLVLATQLFFFGFTKGILDPIYTGGLIYFIEISRLSDWLVMLYALICISPNVFCYKTLLRSIILFSLLSVTTATAYIIMLPASKDISCLLFLLMPVFSSLLFIYVEYGKWAKRGTAH
jgi:hypothetical protein